MFALWTVDGYALCVTAAMFVHADVWAPEALQCCSGRINACIVFALAINRKLLRPGDDTTSQSL
jgi:hypothetical protein